MWVVVPSFARDLEQLTKMVQCSNEGWNGKHTATTSSRERQCKPQMKVLVVSLADTSTGGTSLDGKPFLASVRFPAITISPSRLELSSPLTSILISLLLVLMSSSSPGDDENCFILHGPPLLRDLWKLHLELVGTDSMGICGAICWLSSLLPSLGVSVAWWFWCTNAPSGLILWDKAPSFPQSDRMIFYPDFPSSP